MLHATWMSTIHNLFQIQGDAVQKLIANQKVDQASYLTLYCPALDWILQCLAYGAEPQTLTTVIEKCRKHCNRYSI